MTEAQRGAGMTSARTRERLIGRVREQGVRDARTLEALAAVPRHLFVDEALATRAYEDTALPIGHGQTISQPYIVARMTAALRTTGPLDKVLEIGTGSGYQAAVLAQLAGCLYTVERVGGLLRGARRRFQTLRLTNIVSRHSDGYEGVYVLAATNQPWDVDPALRRPGRFDKSILVLPPDARARESVLLYHLRERPVEEIDMAPVVAATDGFSGADLRLVCEEAAQLAMADAVRTGVVRPIGTADLMSSARAMRPSPVPWLDMARNFVTFANGAGDYDELADYLRERGKRRR